MSANARDAAEKCFLCSRTILADDATTTTAGLSVHRACYDKFVRPDLLPDVPRERPGHTS